MPVSNSVIFALPAILTLLDPSSIVLLMFHRFAFEREWYLSTLHSPQKKQNKLKAMPNVPSETLLHLHYFSLNMSCD